MIIWYQLFDDRGNAYKRTRASTVSLESDASVDQFREAVKNQHDKHIREFDPSDLMVCKTKDAFDRGKEDFLNPSAPVQGLGITEEQRLIVLVPTPLPVHPSLKFQTQKAWTLSPCQFTFFNCIFNAQERDKWLMFDHPLPASPLSRIHIRSCYKTIAESIRPGLNKTIITGTPGTGKSLFHLYLLWKLVKLRARVLFLDVPNIIYYNGHNEVFEISDIPPASDHSFWNENLWCLYDAHGEVPQGLGRFPYDRCTFVLATSPRREFLYGIKKPPFRQIFYIPLWAESELFFISPCFPEAKYWRDHYKILGGIPRHLFEHPLHDPEALLRGICGTRCIDNYMKPISLNSAIPDWNVHFFIHMNSDSPYTKSFSTYASNAALEILTSHGRMGLDAQDRMRELLAYYSGNSLLITLCISLWKNHALNLLANGGTFSCRKLDLKMDDPVRDRSLEVTASVSANLIISQCTLDNMHSVKQDHQSCIDAWIPRVGMFKISLADDQPQEEFTFHDLPIHGYGSHTIYWLVPPMHYHTFTLKENSDLEQFVVRIPYPLKQRPEGYPDLVL